MIFRKITDGGANNIFQVITQNEIEQTEMDSICDEMQICTMSILTTRNARFIRLTNSDECSDNFFAIVPVALLGRLAKAAKAGPVVDQTEKKFDKMIAGVQAHAEENSFSSTNEKPVLKINKGGLDALRGKP